MSTTVLVHEPINDEYEWIQYNDKLRLIRSVKDDMYQMKSIIDACHSNKRATDWFKNDSSRELLEQFEAEKASAGILPDAKTHENRPDLPNELRGWYIHRLLVNTIAMWASPHYAIDIFLLLDKLATQERERLEGKINESKPRLVPKGKDTSYKYMIWKEDVADNPDMILLHLVRRNKRTFRDVNKIKNDSSKCWFYRESLPIAMTPNEDIKALIRRTLPGSEYDIKACDVMTYKQHLSTLHQVITDYFDNFRE